MIIPACSLQHTAPNEGNENREQLSNQENQNALGNLKLIPVFGGGGGM